MPLLRDTVWMRWLKKHVDPCQPGVLLPSVKLVCAVVEQREPETGASLDFIMTMRVIDVSGCEKVEVEETGRPAAHAK